MSEAIRYRFNCFKCGRLQTRELRAGHYVSCKHCGTSNPGPKMKREMEEAAAHPRPRRAKKETTQPAERTEVRHKPAPAARSSAARKPAAAAAEPAGADDPETPPTPTARKPSTPRTRKPAAAAPAGNQPPPPPQATRSLLQTVLYGRRD